MEHFFVTFGAFFGVILAFALIKVYSIRAVRSEHKEFIRQISVGSFFYDPQDWK